jgi:hypothetical protein
MYIFLYQKSGMCRLTPLFMFHFLIHSHSTNILFLWLTNEWKKNWKFIYVCVCVYRLLCLSFSVLIIIFSLHGWPICQSNEKQYDQFPCTFVFLRIQLFPFFEDNMASKGCQSSSIHKSWFNILCTQHTLSLSKCTS